MVNFESKITQPNFNKKNCSTPIPLLLWTLGDIYKAIAELVVIIKEYSYPTYLSAKYKLCLKFILQ